MKKTLILLTLLLGIISTGRAQFEVQTFLAVPQGEQAYVFKSTIGFGLAYRWANYADDRWQLKFFVRYYSFNTLKDTFSAYAYTSDFNQTGEPGLAPGYQTFDNHNVLMLGISPEYRFIDAPLSPFAGLRAGYVYESYDTDLYYETILDYNGGESHQLLGLMPRAGVSYATEKINVTLDLGYGFNLGNRGSHRVFTSSLGLSYFFN